MKLHPTARAVTLRACDLRVGDVLTDENVMEHHVVTGVYVAADHVVASFEGMDKTYQYRYGEPLWLLLP